MEDNAAAILNFHIDTLAGNNAGEHFLFESAPQSENITC